jgi:hypothetical protein
MIAFRRTRRGNHPHAINAKNFQHFDIRIAFDALT